MPCIQVQNLGLFCSYEKKKVPIKYKKVMGTKRSFSEHQLNYPDYVRYYTKTNALTEKKKQ